MTPVEPGQLGAFLAVVLVILGAIVMVLTAINQGRKLWERKEIPAGKEYVTEGRLKETEDRLTGEIARIERDHKEQLTELRKYVADCFHRNGNELQILANKMEALPTRFQEVLDRVIAPLMADTKRNMIAIAKMQARTVVKAVDPETHDDEPV